MSERYPGGYITKNAPQPTGGESGVADGVWTLEQALEYKQAGNWPIPVQPVYVETVFSTYIYDGNNSTQTITNNINLSEKGGLVWSKWRTGYYSGISNVLIDTVRGNTKYLLSNFNASESTSSTAITSFNTNGYSLDSASFINGISPAKYVSWTFREQPKFFDVVTYTGNGVNNRAISHNLGSVPGFIIVKDRSSSYDWQIYHRSLGTTSWLYLNTDGGATTANSPGWNNITSTSFGIGDYVAVNQNGNNYVAYLFAHDAGGFGINGTDSIVSCGSFTTASSGGAATVTLGWEPQWLLVKKTSGAGEWYMVDSMRGFSATGGTATAILNANSDAAEYQSSNFFQPTATGFTTTFLDSSANYIYVAIRRGPMATPTTGTSVYEAYYSTSNLANQTNGSLPAVDFTMQTQAPVPLENYTWTVFDRLRGSNKYLLTYATSAETTGSISFNTSQTGVRNGTWFTAGGVGYNFKRAPGFFDIVCYSGDATTTARPHNLGVAPELMIVKQRNDGAISWYVYAEPLGNNKYLVLDGANGQATANFWNNQTPTSTNFYIRTSGFPNEVGGNYVAYLFASCLGVSKVGSYTGNGTSQTINCGFTSGARFILIKETTFASAGNWVVWDYARGIVAGNDPYLTVNTTNNQVDNKDVVDADSTGFIINETSGPNINTNGATYIFLAIA